MQHVLRRSVFALPRARLLQTQSLALQHGRSLSTGNGSVIEVTSDEDFNKEISSANDAGKLAVVDYSAAWCGPYAGRYIQMMHSTSGNVTFYNAGKVIAPVYQRLSHQYPDARFLKVDIDQPGIEKTVAASNISSVPTFAFFKGGKELARVTGADVVGLRDQLDKMA